MTLHTLVDNYKKEKTTSTIENVDSILDFLASRYLEEHPVTSDEIERIAMEMEPYYESIPFCNSSDLFRKVYDLCGSYEKTAFREGMLVGLQLAKELG